MSANPEIEELVRNLEAAQEGELELSQDVPSADDDRAGVPALPAPARHGQELSGPPVRPALRPLRPGRSGGSRTSEQIS